MTEAYSSTHIYHITDTFEYRSQGRIDAAYSKHRGRLGIAYAGYSFVPAINTIDIGLSVSEFILNAERPDKLILAVNCAPPDKKNGTTNNARNDFFCAQLKNDVVVCGTSNGYEFSYVRQNIDELYRLTTTNSRGSQFRSLEILPEHSLLFSDPTQRARLVNSGTLERVKNIDEIVRQPPTQSLVHEVDSFRNVKFIPSAKDADTLRAVLGAVIRFDFGDASVEVGARKTRQLPQHEALVTSSFFEAPTGTTILTLRSSSSILGGHDSNVPMIATLRECPIETGPNYPVPKVGAPVWLSSRTLGRMAA